MSNSVQSLQSLSVQDQTVQSVQPATKPPTAAKSALPEDTVTISAASKQAQTSNAKPAAGADSDHDGH